jgi:hypothetical protein
MRLRARRRARIGGSGDQNQRRPQPLTLNAGNRDQSRYHDENGHDDRQSFFERIAVEREIVGNRDNRKKKDENARNAEHGAGGSARNERKGAHHDCQPYSVEYKLDHGRFAAAGAKSGCRILRRLRSTDGFA